MYIMEDLFLPIEDQSFFEQLLLEIKGATIQYASWKNKTQRKRTKKNIRKKYNFWKSLMILTVHPAL